MKPAHRILAGLVALATLERAHAVSNWVFPTTTPDRITTNPAATLVGIGTADPQNFEAAANQLVVHRTGANAGITISTGTASRGALYFADGTAVLEDKFRGFLQYNHGNNEMQFGTNAASRMFIGGDGNVGIGAASSGARLSVAGRTSISNGSTSITMATDATGWGDALLQLNGKGGRALSVASTVDGLITEIGVNFALNSGNGHQRYAIAGAKKAPFIQLNGENGSITLFGEKGSGTDWRAPDSSLGLHVQADGKVGIGKKAPQAKLDVWGGDSFFGGETPTAARAEIGGGSYAHTGALTNHQFRIRTNNQDRIAVETDGKVGIGEMSPTEALHVKSAGHTWVGVDRTGGTYEAGFKFMSNRATRFWFFLDNNPTGGENLQLQSAALGTEETDERPRIRFPAASRNIYACMSGGNLAIGHDQPAEKLDVAGNAKVSGILYAASVNTRVWNMPDYVFEKDYKLKTLDEVDAFVKKNKHLPEIPSAKQAESEGIDLGKMNLLLLKKVEELTLHAIRQEKEMKQQRIELARQAAEIRGLRSGH